MFATALIIIVGISLGSSICYGDSTRTHLIQIERITYASTLADIAGVLGKPAQEFDTSNSEKWVAGDVKLGNRWGTIFIERDSVIREVRWKIPMDTLEASYNAFRDSVYAVLIAQFGEPTSGTSTSSIWSLANGFYSFLGLNSFGYMSFRWGPNLSEAEEKAKRLKGLRSLAKELEQSESELSLEVLKLLQMILGEED